MSTKLMSIRGFNVGDIVRFGRPNGELTLGKIIKLNPTKAKVETLESRGTGRAAAAGAVWTVPYSLMSLDNGGPVADPADAPIQYSPFMPHYDQLILQAINAIYSSLSPEWLTADGERPHNQVVALRNKLNQKLRALFVAFGRPVSESVANDWLLQHQKSHGQSV